MAKLTRDTAKRSIDKLFGELPIDAVIEMTTVGATPPGGMAAVVRIEMTCASLPTDPPRRKVAPKRTAAPTTTDKPDKGEEEKPNEDLSGQPGPGVGAGAKRRRAKTGPRSA